MIQLHNALIRNGMVKIGLDGNVVIRLAKLRRLRSFVGSNPLTKDSVDERLSPTHSVNYRRDGAARKEKNRREI